MELLKTKNDSDCVKGGEVGQVRHVSALQHTGPCNRCMNCKLGCTQILLVKRQGATVPSEESYAHGITPPMRSVRQEVFSALETVGPAYLKQVSDQMLQICEVSSQDMLPLIPNAPVTYSCELCCMYTTPGNSSIQV